MGPDSDPARHQYADGFVFKFNADQAQTDEIMLSGNTESQTSLATSIGSDNYTQFDSELVTAWSSRARSASAP